MDNAKNPAEGETKRARNQEWRRKMKELKKQKKEEEIRKNLMSRDSKVVVIDKATFESFNKKSEVGKVEKSNLATSSISPNDFPELRASPKKKVEGKELEQGKKNKRRVSNLSQSSWCWQPIVETLKNENAKDSFPSLESTLNKSKRKPQTNAQKFSEEASASASSTVENNLSRHENDAQKIEKQKPSPQKTNNSLQSSGKTSKKKKHRDPVVLNLKEVLIAKKSVKKDHKRIQVLGSKFRRRTEKEILSGNMLDSSNPRRNRGKHREIKKKKLSNLKLAIIKERIIKSKSKEKAVELAFKNSEVNLNEEIDFKIEVEKYLENLNTRKNDRKINERKNAGKQMKNETLKNTVIAQCNNIPKTLRFSSKFREYCDNLLMPSLDTAIVELIKEIIYLQDRMYARDPIKAHAKKRHVTGFREVRKYLTLKKVKIMVIAPDLEKSESKDSIFDLVYELKEAATLQNVPCIFALDRRKLGYLTKKKVPVSAFAILNYEGAEERFETVMQNYTEARKKFQELISEPEPVIAKEEVIPQPLKSAVSDLTDQLASAFISALTDNPGLSKKESDSDSESNPFLKALKNCDKKLKC